MRGGGFSPNDKTSPQSRLSAGRGGGFSPNDGDSPKSWLSAGDGSSSSSSPKCGGSAACLFNGSEVREQQEALRDSLPVDEVYEVQPLNKQRCFVHSKEMYEQMYWRSLHDSDNFWREMASQNLRWDHIFTKVSASDMENGQICWFVNGKLNVCDNCVDRWAEQFPDRTALIWESDDPSDTVINVSFAKLLENVCKMANLLKHWGVRKGDTVTIYMPMVLPAVYAMLACARLGAVHSVVFAGFSAASLRDRIRDARSRILVTADRGVRGGKHIPLKEIADEAMSGCDELVDKCIVFKRAGGKVPMKAGRDICGDDAMNDMRPYCPLEMVDSEDTLFILYTSGSTGTPKGVVHSSAGYLLYVALTHKFVFDVHAGDVFACVADVGWITGHSYVVYGPLCNGSTTILFESVPTHPDYGRYWALIEKHKATQFYTAPTAIRALMRHGPDWPAKYNLSSLRVLGSVGEPINPEAWRWYHTHIGCNRCNIVDTYWQTETGGHVIAPLPGAIPTKPGSATVPFFGIDPVILDSQTGEELHGPSVHGVLCFRRPWPGMLRSVHGAHERLLSNYMRPYPGYYFTGDGAIRDGDGYYWITGRVDDTLNVSGHRLGAAEIEHALVQHNGVAEAAAVGLPHDVKGTCIMCFVTLKDNYETPENHDAIVLELRNQVRVYIGSIATPDYILITNGLPKTRSGKIMRRILRKVAAGDGDLGDISTLADATVVERLKEDTKKLFERR
eukprot:GHVS01080449.1.p1 GENE.GHVS01080449.1~~GHVS01080449.1.p1  ORF type:complete len:732 (-),score=110.78 GHVS01080449.1:359-2554(-)